MRWRRIIGWGLGAGLAFGVFNAAVNALTQVHDDAVSRAHGITWYNVALPWSLPQYLHAAITSECLFRFAAVVIPAWIVSRLFLKGRADAAVVWTIAVVAAWIEPFMHAAFNRTLPFAGASPLEIALIPTTVSPDLFWPIGVIRWKRCVSVQR